MADDVRFWVRLRFLTLAGFSSFEQQLSPPRESHDRIVAVGLFCSLLSVLHSMRMGLSPVRLRCLQALKRLIEVFQNVVGVFKSAAEAHEIGLDACRLKLFVGHLAMRG